MIVKNKSSIPLLAPEAPLPVKIAIVLLAIVWFRQMVYLFPFLSDNFHPSVYVSPLQQKVIATLAFWLALNITLMLGMAYQKNWARLTQALSTLVGLLLIVWDPAHDFKPGLIYFSDAVAAILLFLPSADAWFKKRQYLRNLARVDSGGHEQLLKEGGRPMSFEPIEPTFGPASVADVARVVTVRRVKKLTLMGTACNVGGTVCFIRSGAPGQTLWVSRMLRLTPPESFIDGVSVFGLNGQSLDALKRDMEFVKAVDVLLSMGTRLELQDSRLTLTVGNAHVKQSQSELSSNVGVAAARIEALGAHSLNDSVGPTRLVRPYRVYFFAGAVLFGLCMGITPPSLAPLQMALCWTVLGGFLAIFVAGVVLPWHLRQSKVAGAIVSNAVISAVGGSFLLGSSVVMIANTYLGERLLAPQDVHIEGTVGVTHGRHASCWLQPDQPVLNLVPGQSLGRLPLKCNEVHYRADPEPHLYDIEVNPGLLDVPFIQSVRELDDQPPMPNASAYPVPFQPQSVHPYPASMPYMAKLAQRINPQIIWHGSGTRLGTTIAIHCASDGKLLSATIIRSSGNPSWDTAVLEAVRRSDPLPVDTNGKAREHFNITVQSKNP
jgi:TonB family protein